jgi:outer membrane protein insertion porin family
MSRWCSLVVLCACGSTAVEVASAPRLACTGSLVELDGLAPVRWGDVPVGTVSQIRVRGALTVPERLVREAILLEPNAALDAEVMRDDVGRILALAVFEDVRVHAEVVGGGVVVTYELVERPLVRHVYVDGVGEGVRADRVERLAGEVFVPRRLHRLGQRLASEHHQEGYSDAVTRVRGRRVGERYVDVCFAVESGPRWLIESFEFEGNESVDDDVLDELVSTYGGRVNAVGGIYREDLLADDLQRVLAAYYDRGHLAVEIGELEIVREEGRIRIALPIEEGPIYRVGDLGVSGALTAPEADYLRLLGLRSGEIFSRGRVMEGIERIRAREAPRAVEITPAVDLDRDRRTVDLEVEVRLYEQIEIEIPPAEAEAP